MSSQPSLPAEWVEALFRRLTAVWGAQKVAAQFAPPTGAEVGWMEDVMNLWGQQLAGFSGDTLRRAMQSIIDSGAEWPPTLPVFRAACRDFHRSVPVGNALPAPGQGSTDPEPARVQLARIKSMLAGAVKVMP